MDARACARARRGPRAVRRRDRRRRAPAGDREGPAPGPGARVTSSTSTCCKVRLDEKIQSTVALELEGVEEAPGVKEGGVLEHVTREVNVEALPTDIPDRIVADVSGLGIAETMTLVQRHAARRASSCSTTSRRRSSPPSPRRPRVEEPEEIEEEAALVGEEGEVREGEEAPRARPPRAARRAPPRAATEGA